MKVPLLDLKRQYESYRSDIEPELLELFRSQMFIMGPQVGEFEADLAKFLQTPYSLGVSSGTDAILLALMALDVKPGDGILLPTYTFFATAGCVARLGAKPIFIDVDYESFNAGAKELEDFFHTHAKKGSDGRWFVGDIPLTGYIHVSLFGSTAPMKPVMDFAKSHGLFVVEDAAQSLSLLDSSTEKMVGTIGDVGCYSFFPSKNLGCFGDGGAVATRNENLHQKMKRLRVHGMEPKYYHHEVGGNFRLDTLQAVVLKKKLPLLRSWGQGRLQNAEFYNDQLKDIKGLKTPSTNGSKTNRLTHIFNQYTILVENRDQVRNRLTELGVSTEVYYPLCLHQQKCFQNYLVGSEHCPMSEELSRRSLSLPIFPELTMEEKQAVVAHVKAAVNS